MGASQARAWHLALGLMLLLAALSGCGGGSGSGSGPAADPKKTATKSAPAIPTPAQTQALLRQGAALSSAELARASVASQTANTAGTPVATKASANKAASSANLVTVWRFYNSQTQAHFYTSSESEKASVLATMPQFSLDGAAFKASNAAGTGLSPVYRFYNTQSGVHFYTVSEDEKAMILASLPQFHLDGVAYFASKVAGTQLTPLYRFFYGSKGFHFYSSSEAERDHIVANLPPYGLEGVGYYVLMDNWGQPPLKLPHSGITDQQCYEAGSDTLVPCSSAGASLLNAQQDGHRTAINAMAYSEVPKPGGGSYARTECVVDNVTHLVWEGKTASGMRAGSNGYTNFDDSTKPQLWSGYAHVNPTEAEINANSNSVGYVNHVNSIALCGFTDWRLPTDDELQGIVDYSLVYPGPTINAEWFPNARSNGFGTRYWSSSPYSGFVESAWVVDFFGGEVTVDRRDMANTVRLIRGIQ